MTAQAVDRPATLASSSAAVLPEPLDLVRALCSALAEAGVSYCHWKSNEALGRSLTGDNDLDLLVARPDSGRFLEILARLGFKAAYLPAQREVPAVGHFYGLDVSGRLVHLHAHFRLVLGDDMTKNFWLPLEDVLLASRSTENHLPVPAPEVELAVLVLRMVLKHSTWDAMLQARGALSGSEKRELAWLLERTTWEAAEDVVARSLPFLLDVWPRCRRAVEPGCSFLARARTAAALVRALQSCSRRSTLRDTTLRVCRRFTWGARRYLLRRPVRKRLTCGGAVVAVVGGDGSGKSTTVGQLTRWLAGPFVVQPVHLGRPPRSVPTRVLRRLLGLARRGGLVADHPERPEPESAPGLGWLLGQVLVARDRRRAYVKARRVAGNGGLVVCDRYPLDQLRSMDGPRAQWVGDLPGTGRLARLLVRLERRAYSVFTAPDVLLVLRVHPDTAVARKQEEGAAYVHRRASEVWAATWDEPAVVLDAARPAAEVLAEARAAVWARL